jgi:hypothetical protein
MDGRRAGGLLVAAVLAAGMVSCGGKSEQASAQELILGATDATFEAGTAQVLLTIGDDESDGQVDFENGQSEVSATVDGEETTVYVDGSDVLVEVGDVVTLVDPDELDVLGTLQELLIAMAPGALVQLLQGLDGDVEILEDETIDGVEASHYALHIDVEALLDELEGEARDLMALLLAALGQDGLDIEVWIDDEGRLIQFQAEFEIDGEPTPVVVGYRDFGSDVSIDIPDPETALSAQEFGTATADIGGRGWVGSNEVVSSTVPGWYDVGPLDPRFRLNLECEPGGSCVNQRSGRDWVASGPGTYTLTDEFIGDCIDTVTGQVTAAGGYRETSEFTWTVTAYDEDGNATEMTEQGTVHGEVIGPGLASGCTIDGSQGGPTSGDAVIEGQATRG